ncbi:PAS domain-containing protein [Pantoea sp. Ap-967]|uniref:hybrid sensor histidine kinase/response regulator n=1 Tax=Pantoea sp. Ap-967 TaxID=2608362 RepID=UPI001420B2BD|nr:ATP-binding protein [Pantoea sp. Ap-967]NIE76142.1 PAS domain-containing protein [Pantoea sp. Ap-967]
MPSCELVALQQQIDDLQHINAQLKLRLACNQEHDPSVYQFLFDTMDQGCCIIEFLDGPQGPLSDYVHVLVNAACSKHTGIARLIGQKVREVVPEEADAWVSRYAEVLRTGQPLQFEQELVATGHVLSVTSFRIEPAQRRQVAVLFKDVTARRDNERELQRTNLALEQRVSQAMTERRWFAELVDHSAANVHMIDSGFHWLAINRQAKLDFCHLYGITPAIGDYMPALMVSNPRDRDLIMPLWERALAGEQFIISDVFGEGAGKRHYELRFNSFRASDGSMAGAYLFAYDISDRVAAEERLHIAEQALRQSQKMEAVGQLSGGVAHDFNNLLGGILGAQELMQQRLQQGRLEQLPQLLEVANGSALRASSVVQRLLAYSRQQALQPYPTEVCSLLRSMEALVRGSIGPAIALHTEFTEWLWPTFIDPPQLESAILNLCINARDAMPDGGTLTVHGNNVNLDTEQAQALCLPPGDYIRLGVKDDGQGMPPEVLARALDPFFTTKPIGQGTGLGLSMVYGFVCQSGGQLRITSSPGEGTHVELFLPRHLAPAMPPAPPKPATKPVSTHTGTRHIVLVEDQASLRLVMCEALEDQGHRVEAFESGPAALAFLAKNAPPDLLISDIGLPDGLTGVQVAERSQALFPGLKVLFVTGYDERAALSGGQPLGNATLLTKPFELSALTDRVAQMLQP